MLLSYRLVGAKKPGHDSAKSSWSSAARSPSSLPATRIMTDGLWGYLCSFIDAVALHRARGAPLARIVGRLHGKNGKGPRSGQIRNLHGCGSFRTEKSLPETPGWSDYPHLADTVAGTELSHAAIPAIYEALTALREKPNTSSTIKRYIKHLVVKRGEEPNLALYDALVAANCCPRTGSARVLHQVMREMRDAGIPMTVGFCHTALRLLAIHPHYLARNSILAHMRTNWMELRPDGKCFVVIGLLRDGQYELALHQFEELFADGLDVPDWVWDILIYRLCKVGFLDEAMQLLQKRLDLHGGDDTKIALDMWYVLLDECSRALHHAGTRYIWDRMVRMEVLRPSDGITLNVLNTAAREGDSTLATLAIQHLSTRKTKLGTHHYEALVESYAVSAEAESAFRVLCIMADAGVPPEAGSTRSIAACLKQSSLESSKAAQILFDMRAKYSVPIEALNVVLEVMCETAQSGSEVIKALDLYRQARWLCPSGPNLRTFELLFPKTRDMDAIEMMHSDMQAFGIHPTATIRDIYIRAHARSGDLKRAYEVLFRFAKPTGRRLAMMSNERKAAAEDRTNVPWIARDTVVALMERSFDEHDNRVWALISEAHLRGMKGLNREVQRLMAKKPAQGSERGHGSTLLPPLTEVQGL